jgi:hypothetical protein
MPNKKFIDYDFDRDVLFVFGAGASVADKVSLQNELLKIVFTSTDAGLKNSKASHRVKSFIEEYFDIVSNGYPSLEAVFGYLDYFITHNEGLGKRFPINEIHEIRRTLIHLIHYVVSINSHRNSDNIYSKFWEIISSVNRNCSPSNPMGPKL